jgi:glucans biosynthesis protein
LPTRNEFLDNVVAMWSPAAAVDGGTRLDVRYELALGPAAIVDTGLARVVDTFVGRDIIDATSKEGQHRFIVDFAGPRLPARPAAASVTARIEPQHGTHILEHQLKRIGRTGTWRLSILARGEREKPLALRAWLHVNGRRASETWRYELDASNVLRRSE